MEKNLAQEVRLLKWYSLILTIVLVLFIAYFFLSKSNKTRFEEIDAERINIVEKDGTLKMVISNQQRQHPGMMDGKMIPSRDRPAGMIFFNNVGDECGGMVYDGNAKESDFSYSIDQFKNDQIMQLDYTEDHSTPKIKRHYGLRMWDEPDALPLGKLLKAADSLKGKGDSALNSYVQQLQEKGLWRTERFFAGKNSDGEVGLFIRDSKGKPRIKLYVDKQNNPRIEFLDENGAPVPVK